MNIFTLAALGMLATVHFHDEIDTREMSIIGACQDLEGKWITPRKDVDNRVTYQFQGTGFTHDLPRDLAIHFDPAKAIGVMNIDGKDEVVFVQQRRKFDFSTRKYFRQMMLVFAIRRNGDEIVMTPFRFFGTDKKHYLTRIMKDQ